MTKSRGAGRTKDERQLLPGLWLHHKHLLQPQCWPPHPSPPTLPRRHLGWPPTAGQDTSTRPQESGIGELRLRPASPKPRESPELPMSPWTSRTGELSLHVSPALVHCELPEP